MYHSQKRTCGHFWMKKWPEQGNYCELRLCNKFNFVGNLRKIFKLDGLKVLNNWMIADGQFLLNAKYYVGQNLAILSFQF